MPAPTPEAERAMHPSQNIAGTLPSTRNATGAQTFALDEAVTIRADHRRVVNALTIPEFLETWLALPDGETFRVQLAAGKNLELQLDSTHLMPLRFFLDPLAIEPDNVRYHWRTPACGFATPTVLDIRIRHSSRRCMLRLRHSGFATPRDRAWHAELWKLSLLNLKRMLEPAAASAEARNAEPLVRYC